MKQIKHPNIVRMYDVKRTFRSIYIFVEFCYDGDLNNYLTS